jgi:hypothetical protein
VVKQSKRENFDVSPEQEADINCFQELIKAPTRKDAILTAVRLALQLTAEVKQGNQVYLGRPGCPDRMRLLMPGIEAPNLPRYLVEHSHPWKRQLYVKGRKLSAASVWTAMQVNKLTREQAAENWDLPIEAIFEIETYCEANRALLEMEAAEEQQRLAEKGISVESKTPRR